MPASTEERDRILQLVEAGQVTALQAANLLDALASEFEQPLKPKRERILRLRVTNLQGGLHKTHMVATVPVGLLKTGVRLGVDLFPQLQSNALEDLLHAVERVPSGRLLDVQDMEKGERLEIFVE